MADNKGLLDRAGFGSETEVLTSKPKTFGVSSGKAVSTTLDDIDFYALNPRRTDNPEFEAIKESIREIGLENPLTLTKRPGNAGYTLYNGGNTRLKALKELWQETKDERFYYQDCRFMPWPEHGDLDVLMKHMIENETRGEMLLIDKANAVYKIKQLHEDETGEKIGLRPLEQLLKTKGWKVGFVRIGVFIFTAEKLADKIPMALANGLGVQKVKELRKTYNAIKTYIDTKLPDLDITEIQEQYLLNLANYDSEVDLGDDYALQDTCCYIGEQVDIDGPRVQLEIDHILRTGTVYDKGSTSSDFNDLGQRITTGQGQENTTTGAEQLLDSTTGAGIDNTGSVSGITGTEATEKTTSEPVLSKKAQHEALVIELGYQVRNKVKMILLTYEKLGKYMKEEEKYPFFSNHRCYK
ncbi:MAG: ParB N-terminal domain-containing protein [Gammaproteobacteria bacterium]|nr:ParB N-terminal domain-containing protein [Gammaproteobacteria bacterium]